ncbi:Peroxiredoxin (Bcp) (PDB:5IPH) [Commensalibacter communis]|uniref:thioredoxin-dependent peroxiredoxin n=1 Tax=Commensalibacter communis TaxID=2972786 RepID=A0A9W4TLM8_9PROT|nr:thioredoxin-dependent thiol peroxidase [Commensalibacter communis]CAI3922883.1 Peroxiredoxin (Bcp) (PDB:5IPH) [Commensalibacter communis]CAI3924325.1 Peroxiredoxin (Bcp) (PDB:5IPH) [Commensalibacter communis]CAI3924398.1 Peroxiredoxin (Bcp) (PDB:5IPH) [Commensalibacter communis]CAI3930301.1 Peroxiredoxin (Bcp) (PDB:5IPH) [Commensalibacter communis]CAI3930392.1 Peroxiredoxin (Bcp) (PDB:5IPH) [Commensalibacter communis]
MTTLTEGAKAPNFEMQTQLDKSISLSELKGKKFILYFYPKADTSGCTKEACAFEENLSTLNKINIPVIGVSRDPVKKLKAFADKYNLTFPLASDEEGHVTEAYGVWVEKSMYGRKYMGIERATFLIDEQGTIVKIWPKVKVTGHVEDVLKTIQELDQ